MSGDVVSLVITGLLSGGLAAAAASLITARANAKNTAAATKALETRLPVEVDSVIVQGAESAVLTMRSALESATKRIAELEADREADRRKIAELERRVEDLRLKVEIANEAVSAAQAASSALRIELEAFVSDQARRR